MDDATMREFKRLWKEAGEVSYGHDEFLRLIFDAAVKLHSGEWHVPIARERSEP